MATSEFGKIRSLIWPIHNYELKKLLPMLLLFFFISFNYSILRTAKDTLVIYAAGTDIIPFLKVWIVTPGAVLFILFYSKLSNMVSKRALFNIATLPFIAYFFLFMVVIYPNLNKMHLTGLADTLRDWIPSSASKNMSDFYNKFIQLIEYWSLSLFYVFSELWGSVMLSLAFWGFANDITKISESKRFYGLFGIGANVALLASGLVGKWLPKYFNGNYDSVLMTTLGLFVVSAGATLLVYNWIHMNVLTDARFYDPNATKTKKSKTKMSLKDSIKFLLGSRYLFLLTMLVLGYGVCINIIEVVWKTQVKALYTSKSDYSSFMSMYQVYLAVLTIFMMFFISGNFLRRFGWRFSAVTTPMVTFVTGVIFFTLIIMIDKNGLDLGDVIGQYLVINPLFLAVIVGTVQNVFSKAAKYSLFDPTKEMAYIPLDEESKVKGKAAIDVIGARFGKAGGSLIQQAMPVAAEGMSAVLAKVSIMVTPAVLIMPSLGVITSLVLIIWIISVYKLAPMFTAAAKAKHETV